jgi:ferredoxin
MKCKMLYAAVAALSLVVFLTGPVMGADSGAGTALTKAHPLQVNAAEDSVQVLAMVNGKYFFEGTRHAMIWEGGKYDGKAVFRSLASPRAFHAALLQLGLKPGDNMTLENKERTHVQGDAVDVSVTWKGAPRAYTLDEVISDSNGKPLQMRFGGNLKLSGEKNTGCLICLDSCPVGIVSNAVYSYGAVEKRNEVVFKARKEVLPADGTLVVVTVKRKS